MRYFLALILALVIAISSYAQTTPEGIEYLANNGKKKEVITLKSGLQYKVLHASTNPLALSPNVSSRCHVHYRGTTIKGQEFDNSFKRGEPTVFAPKDVIQGWNEALQLMHEGDKWQVVIPSELAYGKRSMGEYITPGR